MTDHYKITIMSEAPEGEGQKKMEELIDLIIDTAEDNGYELYMTAGRVDEDGEHIAKPIN